MEVDCEFCGRKFAKGSNLTKHQRTAKYCIRLQEEKAEKEVDLTCEYCQRVLSRTDSLHRHYASCIEYLIYQRVKVFETEIANLKERLAEKDRQLEERERQLWELTNTSINKNTNSYTHIGQVTINNGNDSKYITEPYPLLETKIPGNEAEVTKLIDTLHNQVIDVFGKPGKSPLFLKNNPKIDHL